MSQPRLCLYSLFGMIILIILIFLVLLADICSNNVNRQQKSMSSIAFAFLAFFRQNREWRQWMRFRFPVSYGDIVLVPRLLSLVSLVSLLAALFGSCLCHAVVNTKVFVKRIERKRWCSVSCRSCITSGFACQHPEVWICVHGYWEERSPIKRQCLQF